MGGMSDEQHEQQRSVGSEVATAGPTPPADARETARRVEAVLMTVERPIQPAKIAEAVGVEGAKPVTAAIAALNESYAAEERAFRIEQVAGGYQIMTLPEFREVLAVLHRTKAESKLSPAAMETLAIIAYKQPILRADVEAIRGVASGEVIRSLMDRNLVKIVGRADEIGRPMLYGTTKHFLEVFGLSSLKDLPKAEELKKG
jgi:segregation and condensation protein B